MSRTSSPAPPSLQAYDLDDLPPSPDIDYPTLQDHLSGVEEIDWESTSGEFEFPSDAFTPNSNVPSAKPPTQEDGAGGGMPVECSPDIFLSDLPELPEMSDLSLQPDGQSVDPALCVASWSHAQEPDHAETSAVRTERGEKSKRSSGASNRGTTPRPLDASTSRERANLDLGTPSRPNKWVTAPGVAKKRTGAGRPPAKGKLGKKTRAWVFTYNNYITMDLFRPEMKYIIFGQETSQIGTPHLQGFVVFLNPVNNPAQYFPHGVWLQRAHHSEAAIEYCKKEGRFQEFGTRPKGAGMEALRWESAFAAAKAGDMDKIPTDLRIRYYNTFKRIHLDYKSTPESLPKLSNLWIVGESGVGKSRWAYTNYPDAYRKAQNKWWEAYQGQPVVVIDDLHPDWKGAIALKNWGDHYGFIAEIKGSSLMVRPKKIIVTSNYTIEQVFSELDRDPVERRFVQLRMTAADCFEKIKPRAREMEAMAAAMPYMSPCRAEAEARGFI